MREGVIHREGNLSAFTYFTLLIHIEQRLFVLSAFWETLKSIIGLVEKEAAAAADNLSWETPLEQRQ